VQWRIAELKRQYRAAWPADDLVPYSVEDCAMMQRHLDGLVDERGKQLRPLTAEEERFVHHEWLLTKVDYRYWAERYAVINVEGAGLSRMYPLWESQTLILERLAAAEYAHFKDGDPDGVLANILKARQLGASTLAESIVAHRTTTHGEITALVASDEPESSAKMFRIYRRLLGNLPWFMRPTITDDVKNAEIAFQTGSRVEVGAGKSTRGVEGERGQLGRSGTYSTLHLSEVSTWENADQIDGALLPAVPLSWRVVMLLESTAKGRLNWWHKQWLTTKRRTTRFVNIFIPWYAERRKYWKPAPASWVPTPQTIAHAERCRATSLQFLQRHVTLTREQMYWYEITRAIYEEKDDLATFLEEFCADDEECFQYAGRSIFPLNVRERIRAEAKPLLGVIVVEPRRQQQIDDAHAG
jgi:hypothetical protein